MQPLNYCKQLVKQFSAAIAAPNFPSANRIVLSHAIDLARASQKFMLPATGRLFDDLEFRALDESEPLKLPFDFVALEYENPNGPVAPGSSASSKRIVLARQRDDCVVLMPAFWHDAVGLWALLPEIALPATGYLDRSAPKINGRTVIRVAHSGQVPLVDYEDEIGALLCFLNALQCSNVRMDYTVSSAKRPSAAHQFDSYRVLTIDTGIRRDETTGEQLSVAHRSPREHLRRGHIRRYESGLKVWVNATIVNAGVGGKVSKDYRIAT